LKAAMELAKLRFESVQVYAARMLKAGTHPLHAAVIVFTFTLFLIIFIRHYLSRRAKPAVSSRATILRPVKNPVPESVFAVPTPPRRSPSATSPPIQAPSMTADQSRSVPKAVPSQDESISDKIARIKANIPKPPPPLPPHLQAQLEAARVAVRSAADHMPGSVRPSQAASPVEQTAVPPATLQVSPSIRECAVAVEEVMRLIASPDRLPSGAEATPQAMDVEDAAEVALDAERAGSPLQDRTNSSPLQGLGSEVAITKHVTERPKRRGRKRGAQDAVMEKEPATNEQDMGHTPSKSKLEGDTPSKNKGTPGKRRLFRQPRPSQLPSELERELRGEEAMGCVAHLNKKHKAE